MKVAQSVLKTTSSDKLMFFHNIIYQDVVLNIFLSPCSGSASPALNTATL